MIVKGDFLLALTLWTNLVFLIIGSCTAATTDGNVTYTDDAVIIDAVPSTDIGRNTRLTRQEDYSPSSWFQTLSEGSACLASDGGLGVCVSFHSCYPHIKYDGYEDNWTDDDESCSYFDDYAEQVSGICCTTQRGNDNSGENDDKKHDQGHDQDHDNNHDQVSGPSGFGTGSGGETGFGSGGETGFGSGGETGFGSGGVTGQGSGSKEHSIEQGSSGERNYWQSEPNYNFPENIQWPPPLPTHPPKKEIQNWPPPIPTHPPDHHYPTHPPATQKPSWTQTTTQRPSWTQTTTQRPHKPSTQKTTTKAPSSSQSFACGRKNGVSLDSERIVGGQNASPNEWPWIVVLFNKGRQFCGGALIDHEHVLTAAHCVAQMNSWDVAGLTANLGDHNIRTPFEVKHIERKIKRLVRHKGFEFSTLHNDVAVLTLDKPVTFTNEIRPICLPAPSRKTYSGQLATVAGWGSLRENGPQPSILQKVSIPIWKNPECAQKYGRAAPGGIVESMICAGQASRDSCSGDSGGPLMLNDGGDWTQVGIVSWGIGCGKGQYPGVYTRVTSFLPWIRKNLK